MKLNPDKSVTLIELLIAMSLLGLLVIGISSVDTFSRYQLTSANLRSKLQNEVSFLLEHMAKNINMAIGGVNDTIVTIDDSDRRIRVYIDSNTTGTKGKRDDNDYEIAYQFNATPYNVTYFPDFTNSPSSYETVAHNITIFNVTYTKTPTLTNNYVEVIANACANSTSCGTINNPNVNMTSRIEMPSVSTN